MRTVLPLRHFGVYIKREIHRNRGIHLRKKLIYIQFNTIIIIIRQGEFIVKVHFTSIHQSLLSILYFAGVR